ncbi:MAG: thioredoxin-disulfide reductase [Thermomicrobiales bacterium]
MSIQTTGGSADVIIVGSGPAGWTAALYAARANLSTILFTGLQAGGSPGGQLMLTSEVENFPGFEDGILGPELMANMRRQAERFGVRVVEDDVVRVAFGARPLQVFTGDESAQTAYRGKSVVIATGASAIWLGLPSEQRLIGRGVSSCATCDGFFFRNQEIAVVGGGDSALEEAIYLTRHAAKVTVVHRKETLRASKIMQDRARANPKIEWMLGREVAEVLGDENVRGLRLRRADGNEEELAVSGVFVAIGHRPNTDLFRGVIDMDEAGYIVATEHTATNVPGVFVAGDVHDRRYRQAVTAAGEGCKAALNAEEYITGEIWTDWSFGDGPTVGAGSESAAPRTTQPKITMYTTGWCPDCRAAKSYLTRLGLTWSEVDIEQTPGAADLVERWSGGFQTVPTFDIDGRIVVDFDREALDLALSVA